MFKKYFPLSPPPTLLSGIQSLATVAGQSVVPELPAAIVLSVWKEFVSVDAWRKLYSAVQYKIVHRKVQDLVADGAVPRLAPDAARVAPCREGFI